MTKLILVGEGGQGVQTVAKVLAQVGRKAGYEISYIPSFGVEQRGGVSFAFLQFDNIPIGFSRFAKADIIVAFCNRAMEKIAEYFKDDSLFIYDNSAIDNDHLELVKNINNFMALPAQKLALENQAIKSLNMIILGALAQVLELKLDDIIKEINESLAEKIKKNPQIGEKNESLLKLGYEFAAKYKSDQKPSAITKPKIETTFTKDGKTWKRFPEYCKGCALCIAKCPVGALKFSTDLGFLGNPMPIVDMEKCIACGKCAQICPDGAIEVEKK